VVAFCQGARDEKMLEKLATHNIKDVAELFSLVDKCVRANPMRALLPKEAAVRTTIRRRMTTTISC
jgi:hypothetical protein